MPLPSHLPALLRPWPLAAALASPAAARDHGFRGRTLAIDVVAARYDETYLREVPLKLATAQLDLERAFFVSAGIERAVVRRFSVLGLGGNALALNVQGVKHFNGQDHVEGTAAVTWRFGNIGLVRQSSVNVALSPGFSYATERPRFEYGPGYRGPAGGIRGLGSRQFQFYLGVEAEFSGSRDGRWHLVGKLHHRSGGYGIISPQRTGSNYLGLGLRYDLARR